MFRNSDKKVSFHRKNELFRKTRLFWVVLHHCDEAKSKLSLVIAQFVWHPIGACLWGLTRRRINRFKYGRFSIFHHDQGFSSQMSFTANYAHRGVHQSKRHQLWKTKLTDVCEAASFYDDETHGFNGVSRHISRKINLVLESLQRCTATSRVPLIFAP